ncbi:hypothetical protein GCM10009006_35210 [Haloarcula argentinensis]|uniref:Uncharacterized protein n=1 Tax=Haloarcula argentinensis TaxID=43776 RepID=A0A830FHN9_HALAR|nr:hypothetical protein GCM10009006_35210 [Haloarcula argentinensis]
MTVIHFELIPPTEALSEQYLDWSSQLLDRARFYDKFFVKLCRDTENDFYSIALYLCTTIMMYSPVAGWEADTVSVPHMSGTSLYWTIHQEERQWVSDLSDISLV